RPVQLDPDHHRDLRGSGLGFCQLDASGGGDGGDPVWPSAALQALEAPRFVATPRTPESAAGVESR
ncbi:MAG: hypothetical protein AAF230_04470, partial [Pseudomonadota bacterium]